MRCAGKPVLAARLRIDASPEVGESIVTLEGAIAPDELQTPERELDALLLADTKQQGAWVGASAPNTCSARICCRMSVLTSTSEAWRRCIDSIAISRSSRSSPVSSESLP
jgi:hypothetical protein